MKKMLVRIARTEPEIMYHRAVDREMEFLPTVKVENVERDAEVFFVNENRVDDVVRLLSEKNPGVDVEVYDLTWVGHCPAAEFVLKKVTADGILPA